MTSRQIAILQTAFLGDTLLSLPLAKALQAQGERLALICRKGYGGFFLATRLFETIIEVEKGNSVSYRAARESLNIWWANSVDRVLLSPHESPRSKGFALAMRLRGEATATIGYGDRGLMQGPSLAAYTERVRRPMELPEALRQLALLQVNPFSEAEMWRTRLDAFLRSQGQSGGRDPSGGLLVVPAWASMTVGAFAEAVREKTAVLAPGSVWKTKQWTPTGYSEIGRKFRDAGRSVVIIGTKEEAALCEQIALAIGSGARSVAGQTSLLETARQIAKSEIAIVNDSGAMHLAAVSDTPVVAVFGPTVLDFGYRPWSNKARVLEPGALKCRPCGLHGAQVCPIGTHVCMTMTDDRKVWDQAQSLISL